MGSIAVIEYSMRPGRESSQLLAPLALSQTFTRITDRTGRLRSIDTSSTFDSRLANAKDEGLTEVEGSMGF